jgi:hypothetical protein
MAVSRRVAVFAGVLLAALTLVALGVGILTVGLAKANEIAGVIGGFTAVAGLGLSVYGVILARRQRPSTGTTVDQVVSNAIISGDNIQIGQARDVHLRDK